MRLSENTDECISCIRSITKWMTKRNEIGNPLRNNRASYGKGVLSTKLEKLESVPWWISHAGHSWQSFKRHVNCTLHALRPQKTGWSAARWASCRKGPQQDLFLDPKHQKLNWLCQFQAMLFTVLQCPCVWYTKAHCMQHARAPVESA